MKAPKIPISVLLCISQLCLATTLNARTSKDSSGSSEQNPFSNDWGTEDIDSAFPELQILNDISSSSSKKQMELATDLYDQGLKELKLGELKVKELKLGWKTEHLRYDWQRRENLGQQKRHIKRIRGRFNIRAGTFLHRALEVTEQIRNPSIVASEPYVELLSKIFRQYIKVQFRARKLELCINLIEKYLRLRPAHETEPEPHRILAYCYRHQETQARKAQNVENELYYKKNKTRHLLQYATLVYGRQSEEYAQIARQLNRNVSVININ